MVAPEHSSAGRGLRPRFPKILILFFVPILFWALTGFGLMHSTGMVGTTEKTGGGGCLCHGTGTPSASVRVWVEGPASVRAGSSGAFRLKMTGGPAVTGGFNLAAGHGTLVATDPMTQALQGELTHTDPRAFVNDTVGWEFQYSAPPDTGRDTLFSVGNSVNGDFIPPGDEFNFGEMFALHISAESATAVGEFPVPASFRIKQNYPNPFNPSTKIPYTMGVAGRVTLEVYDISGVRMAVLFDARRGRGSYEAEWDAADTPAGIYFCRISAEGASQVIKMVFIR